MPTKTPDPYVAFLEAKLATEVGPHEARQLVDDGSAILLDVRSAESRAGGHVPGSLHIPRKDLAARVGELPTSKTIVCYCSDIGCQSSLKATIELRKAGFDARHMIGNFKGWVDKGYPMAGTSTTKPMAVAAGRK